VLGSKVYYEDEDDDDDDVHIKNLLCFVHFVSPKDQCVTTIAFNTFVKQKFYAFCE